MLLKLICFVICMLHLSLEDTAKMARMSRATETKLSILIDHFQSLSRISNGISLKIGLLDGSYPSDDVIIELLHLGQLKLQDILDLQTSNTESALNQFDALPKSLETTPEVINIENRLVLLVDTRNYRMENYQNFTGRPDYEQHLKEVIKLKDIHSKISRLKKDVGIWIGLISYFEDWSKGMDDPTAVDAFGKFSDILKYLVAIESLPKSFKTYTDQLKTAKLIKRKSRFIDQLENESVSRKKLFVSTKYTDEGLNTIKTELKTTLDTGKIVNKARSAFQTISQLIRPQPFFYKYSSGFSGGGEDLAKLSKDVSDEWILKHVSNGTLVTENLNGLFVEMDELETQFEKVKISWDPVKEKSVQVEPKISLLLKLTEIEHVDLNTITDASFKLKKCDKENSAYTSANFDDLKPVLDDIDKLNKKLDGISNFNYVSQFEDLSLLKKALESIEPPPATDAEKAKVARDVVKKMISTPDFSKILSLLEDFSKDLEAFETSITESTTLASQIKFTDIDDYHKTTKGYMKIYECIGEVGENGAKLRNLLKLIEEIRPLKLPSGNVSPMINLILDSRDNLSKLKDYLKNMKNPDASNSLKESFPNFEEVSHNLGVAVQGFVAVKEAADAKSELQSLLDLALDPKNLGNVQELKTLAELFKEIDDFLSFLDDVDGLRKKRQTADFKNDQQVFVEAHKISSWKVDMEKFKSEIEAIGGNHKAVLDKLATLDLDFSKFKFSQAVSSLTALDDLFTLFGTKLNLQPLVTPPNGNMQPQDDLHMELQVNFEPGEMAESPLAWVGDYAVVKISGCILLIVFFVVFLVIGLISLFCPQCWGFCGVVDNDGPENPVDNRQTKHPETSKLTVTPINEEKVEHAEPEIRDKGKTKKGTSKGTENKNSTEEKSKELVPGKGKPEEKVTIKKVTEKPNHENNSNNDPNTKKKNKYDPNSKNKNSKQGAGKNDEKKVKTVNVPKKRPKDPSAKHSSSRESAAREKKKLNAVVLRRDAVLDEEGKKSLFYFMDYILGGIDTNISKQRKYPNEILMDIFASINKSESQFDTYLDYAENQSERIERARICLESSMVVLKGFESTDGYRKTNYYNGSVHIEGRKKWIVAQDPMDGTEVETYGENDISIKANTIEKHLGAIHQHDVERVIRFTPFEREGEKVCARWHREDVDIDGTNLMRFGRYSVQTVGKESEVERFNNPDMFIKYLLKITDLVTKISKNVVVIFYNWNNPKDPKDGQDILNYLDESKGNVMLQDRNGLGASCVIMAIKFTIVKHEFVHSIEQMIRFVSDWRRGAIRNAGDVFYMLLCIIESLMEFNKVEFTMVYHSFDYYYDKFLEGGFDRGNKNRINLFERNGLQGSREEYVEQKFKEYEEKKAAESKKTNKTLKKAKNVDAGDVDFENQSNQQNVDTMEIKKEQSLKNQPEKSATGQKSSKSTKLVAQKSSKSNKNLDGSKKKVT
ncbi:hypothetical protein CAEBREN_25770 [Caenorhabditis brenneri]|uniref:Tyrosine-protein phosphatase domain-containing protein n=1 Tax=Caenorhabditis brenneri TaxID=135651 RepID=G0N658_CAEBE|nr:hypothetical protein CAEBREN_25770 [Caenorhabditis brenneri]